MPGRRSSTAAPLLLPQPLAGEAGDDRRSAAPLGYDAERPVPAPDRRPPPAACDRATADDPADAAAAPPQAAPDHGAPIFPYWTGTKTAIAICALKLAEQGRADLDACLPDHGVTLRQFLNHTAGLPDYATLDSYRQGGARDEEP